MSHASTFQQRGSARASSTPNGPAPLGAFAFAAAGITPDRASRARFNRGDSPRSGQPVWRNSYTVGQVEDRVWKPIGGGTARGGKRWTAALLKAAKQYEIRTRAKRREVEPGTRNGDLGEVGIEVLEFLYSSVDYATGRLDPAIRTIAAAIGRAYSAVHEALKRLRRHGFLHWMRRSKPVENPEPGGQQVEQASNAYALLCPKPLQGWLSRLFRKAPTPECEADRRKREKEQFEAMLEHLSAQDRHTLTWNGDTLLGETLRRIAAAVDARDSQKGESSTSDETGGI
ncbi:hypothetical protein [Sphingomonas sp. 3-13AW]|uniref:hypothetical protein n=1 Tax=Sphingomonas sp. 3-13AW TaxID=3050450 RepID=UPI003BB8063E